ncbi:MAG TPA: alpha/beta hydrolase [Bryobacteraceae bacterium]|nr:alpha/beta hydrolase [Bryobacteraceae bacterium]
MKKRPRIPLLFLPGLLCDREVWEYQTRALADIAECTTAEWNGEDSLAAMAQAALRIAPERFAVAGHSMGGRVALEIYRAAPERVQYVALLNTGYLPLPQDASGEQEARNRYALLEIAKTQGMRAMARQWLPPMISPARHADGALTETIVEMFARKTPEIFEAQIRALLSRPDATPVLEQIRCPALLLSGREDGWSPPARHAEMAKKVPGPSTVVTVPDCGHMSTLEQPAAVAEAMRRWLTD